MELHLRRLFSGKDSTIGYLQVIDNDFYSFTLEDEKREIKVKHETRIPAGKYVIKFREVPSKMTMKYRERYDFFNFHLQLQNVPGFNYVYIHSGSYDGNTSGCLLIGFNAMLPGSEIKPAEEETMISSSRKAFKKFYILLKQALDKGEKVSITIIDK